MDLEECKDLVENRLLENNIVFESHFDGPTESWHFKHEEKYGYFVIKDGQFIGVVVNIWYLAYLKKEGFEEKFLLENSEVWLKVDDVNEFSNYFLNLKFKTTNAKHKQTDS